MDYTAIFNALKPILAQGTRDGLRLIGMGLATHGFIESGAGTEAFIGAGMTLAGLFWGWFTTKGYLQVGALLKKVTATKTAGDAVKAAQVLPPAAAVDTAMKAASVQSVVAKVLLAAFALSLFLAGAPAFAEGSAKKTSTKNQAIASPVNPLQTFLDQINAKVSAINALTLADAQAAMVMAANDPVGLACYTAVANKLQAAQAGGSSLVPKSLGVLQLIETARLAKLQISGIQNGTDPIVTGCAPLILDVNTTLLMLTGQGVIGAAGASIGIPGL